ncbi:MAG TPA: inorganic diphosphatase [Candidatus Dormibacteraeota bacterium]
MATFEVLVEVPKGSRNKYEVDHETGQIWLDRELFTATRYPADYGFVPETLEEDGDPLDALVLLGEPTFPGCRIHCRALGLLLMSDEQGPDAKLLAVPATDPRIPWQDVGDIPSHLLDEITHFFDIYKELEPGKHTIVHKWVGRDEAEERIETARSRAETGSC